MHLTVKKNIHFVILFTIFSTLIACARGLDYKILDSHMRVDNCSVATEYVKKNKAGYGTNKKLLFLLDSAMVNTLCGNYKKSNAYLHDAEELAEKLWTKSILRETASFLINDYIISYAGEDFERAFINLFSALNYAMLDQPDEALVESRRLDSLLSILNAKYEQKNVYKEDAFGRYFSGIIYESENNIDDAFIDYYKAFQIFHDYQTDYGTPVPSILAEDLLRIAKAADRLDEVQPALKKFNLNNIMDYNDTKKFGKIVFIHFNGKSPVKVEDKLYIPTKHGPITIAFPRYVKHPPSCRNSTLIVESEFGLIETNTELVEDINSIAVKNMADRKARLVAKTIARAVAKQVVLNAAASQIENRAARNTAKLCFNAANMIIERADTRSWRTLPGEIYLARAYVPEGEHTVSVRLCGREKRNLRSFNIKAGKTKFVLFENMY